jgi:hypothetical protein
MAFLLMEMRRNPSSDSGQSRTLFPDSQAKAWGCDELPPILAGLQWVWMHPTLKTENLALLAAKILAGKNATGRTGMGLWQILVLGVLRLGLDADWDRMEDLANHHTLIRQMLGLPATAWDDESKQFGHQTLRDNVALLDDELLQQINARIAAAGREVFTKKAARPWRRLKSRWTPMCWRPTCISLPI